MLVVVIRKGERRMVNDDGVEMVRKVVGGKIRERDDGSGIMINWRYGLLGSALRVLTVFMEFVIRADFV